MKSRNTVKSLFAGTLLALTSAAIQAHEIENQPTVTKIKFVGDTQFSGFCQAIVDNNIETLLSQAARVVGKVAPSRRGVIRVVTSEDGVTCNGKSLIEFSEEKDATDVYAYLIAQR